MVPVDIWVNYMWKDNKIQAKMYFNCLHRKRNKLSQTH